MKPLAPMREPQDAFMKPKTSLRTKIAPKTAVSGSQWRRRFHWRQSTRQQRRQRFHVSRRPHPWRQQGLAAVPGRAVRTSASPTAPQVPPVWRAPDSLAAVPVGGGRAWPDNESTRRAEGSRRGRRAGGPPPTGTLSSPVPQPGPTAPRTPAAPQATTRPGIQETDIRIGCRSVVELGGFEPPTFSLRTRRATNCAIAPRTHTA